MSTEAPVADVTLTLHRRWLHSDKVAVNLDACALLQVEEYRLDRGTEPVDPAKPDGFHRPVRPPAWRLVAYQAGVAEEETNGIWIAVALPEESARFLLAEILAAQDRPPWAASSPVTITAGGPSDAF